MRSSLSANPSQVTYGPQELNDLAQHSPPRTSLLGHDHIASRHASARPGDERLTATPTQRFRNAVLQHMAPAERANVSWSLLAANTPEMVAQQRATCLSNAQAMFNTGELKLPNAFKGRVTRGSDGMLTSPDKAVAAILRYAQIKNPATFRDLEIGDACTLGLPLDPSVLLQARQFAHGCAVRNLNLSDGTSSEVHIDMTTYATREAIKKGKQGFGDNAKLTHRSTGNAEAEALLSSEGQHPFDFLRNCRFQPDSSSQALQDAVANCLNDNDPTTLELRGRLGALAVKSVFSQKQLTNDTWIALALSLAASGGVAVALDIFAWGAVHNQLSDKFGKEDPRTRLADVLLASLTPAIAETIDSFVVGRLIEKMRGGSFTPESLSEAWDTLKNSMKAGGVAAIGSLGNNALEHAKKWAFQPLNFVANQIAVATSGAMVPIEVAKTHKHMAAGLLEHVNNGFFPVPEVAGRDMTPAQQHKAFAQHAKKATTPALDVAPGDGLAINSMGIGGLVSQMAFLPVDALARVGKIKEVVKSIVAIITNTPTEVISTTIGNITGPRLGGLGKAMTTDDEKDRLMVALIAEKAILRLRAPYPEHPDASAKVSETEMHAIERPALELTFKAGKLITGTMNQTVSLLANVFGVLRGRPPQSLAEKVDLTHLREREQNALSMTDV